MDLGTADSYPPVCLLQIQPGPFAKRSGLKYSRFPPRHHTIGAQMAWTLIPDSCGRHCVYMPFVNQSNQSIMRKHCEPKRKQKHNKQHKNTTTITTKRKPHHKNKNGQTKSKKQQRNNKQHNKNTKKKLKNNYTGISRLLSRRLFGFVVKHWFLQCFSKTNFSTTFSTWGRISRRLFRPKFR